MQSDIVWGPLKYCTKRYRDAIHRVFFDLRPKYVAVHNAKPVAFGAKGRKEGGTAGKCGTLNRRGV